MSHSNSGDSRPPGGGSGPQNTVFRRPCFQIAVNGSGEGARLGVRVVAGAPGAHGAGGG
ncbi:MAG TPA: hypothetical protein VIG99_19525 [Myxococcaceae bacterium]